MNLKMNDINLYYELHGAGKGSPLILIAGFSCDHTFWTSVLNLLSAYHQVIIFDNRGIGQTVCSDSSFSIEMMADDVMALIQQLNLKKPIIIGQSMGSAIAQDIGRRYAAQIEKIVLMNTFAYLTKLPEMVFELVGEFQRMNLPLIYQVKSVLPWVYSNAFLSEQGQVANLIRFAQQNPYPQSLLGYERQLTALKLFDSRTWLHEVKTSALIIAGEEDIIAPVVGAKQVQNKLSNQTQMVMVPGGHASPIEQPKKVAKAILEFVN